MTVIMGLKNIGLMTTSGYWSRMRRHWGQETRTNCIETTIGKTYVYIRNNPGTFKVTDLCTVLEIQPRALYDILPILAGLSVLRKEGSYYKTPLLLDSAAALPWQQELDDIWGTSKESTTRSLGIQRDSPECQVARITVDNSTFKTDAENTGLQSVSILGESNGTHVDPYENKVERKDTVDLKLENAQLDEFLTLIPESGVDLTVADGQRGCMDTDAPRAESTGKQSESQETQVGRMDTVDLTCEELHLEDLLFDESTMAFLERRIDWRIADSLRGCMDLAESMDDWPDADNIRESLLCLDMQREECFEFNEDTATDPTAQDIDEIIQFLEAPL